ncbi:TFIIH/NER complex subunit [Ciborinia camelliae]|nr:TFIIH/NER complex subunit [Ciborinia camelliae]
MPSKPLENSSDDICPICKSNRYLNPSLQFLINPECYHKMCATCVDRIFTSGPAPCPVPHCGRTLRKKGFKAAFFGDLAIERECDIRRRVSEVFNRSEDDFETLLDFNNYLQETEDLIFDLVNGKGRVKQDAEEKLRRFREANRGAIEENKIARLREVEMGRRRELEEREMARQRRLAAMREEAEEKADVEKSRKQILDQLATGEGDAVAITQQAHKIILKKSSARRALGERDATIGAVNESADGEGLTIRGLKKKKAPVAEKPYDPFGGIDLTPTKYVLQDDYENQWIEGVKRDPKHMAGGYSLHDYYGRAMLDAFSGLEIFIEDEVRDRPQHGTPSIATTAAAQASKGKIKLEHKMELDDVF